MSTNQPNPVVHVVDDDAAMLDSLRFLIESVGLTVATFQTVEAFLAATCPHTPGCLVADLRLPGPLDGLDMHDQMQRCGINLPTIVITAHGEVPHAVRAFRSGVVDFIQKPLAHSVLIDRVQSAIETDRHRRAEAARCQALHERESQLSTRERQVMDHVAAGESNRQIAAELDLSPKTIEVHRASVMTKMQAQSLPDLVRMTIQRSGQPTHPREKPHAQNTTEPSP